MNDLNGNPMGTYAKGSKVKHPATKLVFADESANYCGDGCFGLDPAGSWPTIKKWWNPPGIRHDVGATFSFFDGHVEYYKWHGNSVKVNATYVYGDGNTLSADSSDDLARVVAGGSEYGYSYPP